MANKHIQAVLGDGKSGVEASWWDAIAEAESSKGGSKKKTGEARRLAPTADEVGHFRKVGQQALNASVADWEARKQTAGTAEDRFSRRMLAQGTAADKLAALSLMIADSPVHSLEHIDRLLALGKKKVARDQQQSLNTLRDLFVNTLLPPDRQLRNLVAQPALFKAGPGRREEQPDPSLLAVLVFEEELRKRSRQFLALLEELARPPTMPWLRELAMKTAWEMLCERPEGEDRLLALLISKLCDRTRSVASKAVYLLSRLAGRHEAMLLVIIREVRQFLLGPQAKGSPRAQYYAIILLSQIAIPRDWPVVPLTLLRTYLEAFDEALAAVVDTAPAKAASKGRKGAKKKGGRPGKGGQAKGEEDKAGKAAGPVDGVGARLLSALLTGVNRAFPFVEGLTAEAAKEMAARRSQATAGAGEAAKTEDEDEEDAHAGAARLLGQLDARMDSIFKAVHVTALPTAIQALSLLQRLVRVRPGMADRFHHALYNRMAATAGGQEEGDILTSSSAHGLFLNVVFRAMRDDQHLPRAVAVLRRLLQLGLQSPSPAFTAAAVFTVGEVVAARPPLAKALRQLDATGRQQAQPGDEPADEEAGKAAVAGGKLTKGKAKPRRPRARADHYDAVCRDPRNAGALTEPIWELSALVTHFHPSVRAFAAQLLGAADGVAPGGRPFAAISYKGDPLRDLTLTAFLERFSYKNPKKRDQAAAAAAEAGGVASAADKRDEEWLVAQGKEQELEQRRLERKGLLRGRSIMQPRGKPRHGRSAVAAPVNAGGLSSMPLDLVRAEERFYRLYFDMPGSKASGASKGRRTDGADLDDDEVDAYADVLAQRLMEDGDKVDEEDADPEDFAYGDENIPEGLMAAPEFDGGADDDDDDDDDSDGDDDDDDDDDGELMAMFGGDNDDGAEEAAAPNGARSGPFASLDEFAKQMDEADERDAGLGIVDQGGEEDQDESAAAAAGGGASRAKPSKAAGKKRRRAPRGKK